MPTHAETQRIVEELVSACLDRLPQEGSQVVEGVCHEYPELIPTVRAVLGSLSRVGLIADTGSAVPARVSDTLGDYRLIKRIGGGGMGEVFLAEQVSLKRRVALKLMRPVELLSGKSRERFRREIDAVAQLDHPGLCPVYDAGEIDGTPYLAMRYLEGRSLAEILDGERTARDTPVSGPRRTSGGSVREVIDEKVAWIEKVARTLHLAHEKGLVHRDVKPGNVMITTEREPVLLDFGLAHVAAGEQPTLTLTGDVLGTPAYMAPEQVAGGPVVDRRSDVYGLGATLYEALTLHCPHEAATRDTLYQKILRGEIERASRRNPAIQRDLEIVLETALDCDAGRRYRTALAFADDLRRVQRREPIQARRIGTVLRARRWAQRNRAAATFLVMLTLALVVTVWFLVLFDRNLRTTRARALAYAAEKEMVKDQMFSLHLALAAVQAGECLETRSQLHRALAHAYERRVFEGAGHCLDATPDGQHFVTGGIDRSVRLWRIDRDEPQWVRKAAHEGTVFFVGFVGQSCNRIVSFSWEGELKLWDLQGEVLNTYPLVTTTPPPLGMYANAVVSPDRTRLLAGFYKTAQLFSFSRDRFEPLGDPLPHEDYVGALAFRPDGQQIATGTGRFTRSGMTAKRHRLWLWDVAADGPQNRRRLDERDRPYVNLCFSRDGERLLCGAENVAVLCDLQTGVNRDLPAGRGAVDVRFASVQGPEGLHDLMLTWARREGAFGTWKPDSRMLRPSRELRSAFRLTDVCHDGTWCVFAGEDGAYVLDTLTGKRIAVLRGHRAHVMEARFVTGTRDILTMSADGTARLWRVEDRPRVFHAHAEAAMVALVALDGERILTAAAQPFAKVWSSVGDHLFTKRVRSKDWGNDAAFSPDGRAFATTRERMLSVWDSAKGALIKRIELDAAAQKFVKFCFLPGGEIAVRVHKRVDVWDYVTGETRVAFQFKGPCDWMVASPQGDRILLFGKSTRLYQLDRGTGAWTLALEEPFDGKSSVAGCFSPSGDRILVGRPNGLIHVLNADGRRLPFQLVGHTMRITWVAFSADGELVASASEDGTARLWRRDGTPLAILEVLQGGTVHQANFTPDGRYVYTAHEDGTVRRWFVDTDELIDDAKSRITRELTDDQRQKYPELRGN